MITAVTFFNWNYRPDGSLFAIEGGINKAPREQLQAQPQAGRAGRGGPGGAASGARGAARGGPRGGAGAGGAAGAELRYRAYREYRDAFPELILLNRNDDFPELSAAIDKAIPAAARAQLRPAPIVKSHPESTWAMAAPGKAYLVYSMAGDPIDLDLSNDPATFTLSWLDSTNGELRPASSPITAGQPQTLTPPPSDTKHPWIAWLTRP
jgi:hypothetical protein